MTNKRIKNRPQKPLAGFAAAHLLDARQYVWNWPGVAVSHLDAAY